MKKAFSLIELLIVMAIIAILGATVTPFLSNSIIRNNMRNMEDNLQSYLRKAQTYSMNGKNASLWGVCVFDDKLSLFKDSCSEANIIDTYQIPANLNISGLSPVIFSQSGGANSDFDIIINSPISQSTFSINQSGSFVGNETLFLGAYWPMNENTGSIVADIVNDNDGNIAGASWTEGVLGSALLFDANAGVSVVDSESFDFTNQFTVEAWMKWTVDPASGANWATIVAQGGDSGWGIQHNNTNQKIEFYINTDSGRNYVLGSTTMEENNWFYLVGTYDGTEMKLYINGTEEDSLGKTGLMDDLSTNISIGRRSDGRAFQGVVDEVRLIDQSLSASDILDRYNSMKPNEELGMVSYWPLDEGSGVIALDSQDGNDFSVIGSSWTSGVIGTGLEFNGIDDYTMAVDADNLDVIDGLTMMLWVKVSEYKTAKVFEKGDWDGNSIGLDNWGGWKASLRGSDANSYRLEWADGRPELNEWYHLALTYDGSVGRLYVDGVEVDQVDINLDLATNNRQLNLASDQGSQKFFAGVMDEVYYYDRALSSTAINNYYLATLPDEPGELLAYWPMNEGSGSLAEEIINANDAVVNGATWTTGVLGNGLNFDGDDYLESPTSYLLNIDDLELTVEAWVKWGVDPSTADGWANIIYKDSLYSGGPHYQMQHSANNSRFEWVVSTTDDTNKYIWSTSTTTNGGWYYLVGTYDGAETKLYVNGVLENSSSLTGELQSSNSPVYIGSGNSSSSTLNRFFQGDIDEVKIHDKVLTAEEIATNYANNAPEQGVQIPDPVAYWNFDEGSGSVLTDSIGNNDGFIQNPNWLSAGVVNGAMAFDGVSNEVELTNADDLNPDDVISVNVWFQREALDSDGTVLFKNSQYFIRSDSFGRYSLVLYLPSWTNVVMSWGDRIQDLDWHMLTSTFDGSQMKLYLDGQEFASMTASGSIQLRTNTPYIGSAGGSSFFNGKLDEMKLWHQALTEEQVTAIYESYQ